MNIHEFKKVLAGVEEMHSYEEVQIQSISTQENKVFTLETDSKYMYATVTAFTKKQESISLADETDH
jgi:hypothetical protein